jgi:hypothetical protein
VSARPVVGKLEPGQPVMVRRSYNDMRRRKREEWAIPAVVVKVGRVWVDLKVDESARDGLRFMTWRMRLDTQDEGTQYSGSNASFATLEQHQWDETQHWARGVLREQGIEVRMSGRWTGREVELAQLLIQGEGEVR